jgi:hypothetical protein
MRFIIALSIAGACFGQGKQNIIQTGLVDAHGASWIFPGAMFASPPSTPATGSVYVFTDASAVGTCSGGGNALATCRWSGSAWAAVGGGGGGVPGGASGQVQVNSGGAFGGQNSIFSGATSVQNAVECAHGTTSYTALTAAAASQEIAIQTGISGNIRYAGVLLSETTQFVGGTGLTVSMGRPGSSTNAEMTNGYLFPLMVSGGDVNYVSTRPIPPQMTSTYSIVLNFAVTAGNVNAVTAGSLTWEVCGYAAR